MQHHKYSLTELENMLPWEREIYLGLLIQYLEEENEKLKQQKLAKRKTWHQDSQKSIEVKRRPVVV
jgi:hypothetical protein